MPAPGRRRPIGPARPRWTDGQVGSTGEPRSCADRPTGRGPLAGRTLGGSRPPRATRFGGRPRNDDGSSPGPTAPAPAARHRPDGGSGGAPDDQLGSAVRSQVEERRHQHRHHRLGGHPHREGHRAGRLDRHLEGRGAEDQTVGPADDGALVGWSGLGRHLQSGQERPAPDRRRRIVGIEGERPRPPGPGLPNGCLPNGCVPNGPILNSRVLEEGLGPLDAELLGQWPVDLPRPGERRARSPVVATAGPPTNRRHR